MNFDLARQVKAGIQRIKKYGWDQGTVVELTHGKPQARVCMVAAFQSNYTMTPVLKEIERTLLEECAECRRRRNLFRNPYYDQDEVVWHHNDRHLSYDETDKVIGLLTRTLQRVKGV